MRPVFVVIDYNTSGGCRHRRRANQPIGTATGWKNAINSLAMYYGERITGQ